MMLVGMAMFGTITFVPLFVQGVIGTSATSSGVVLTPFMLGAVATSIVSGQVISRVGRYKQNVVLGPLVLGAGLWGLASALAINAVARSRRIGADAAIGVVTTASFALGVALLTRFGNTGPSFDALLFGSINGVASSDLLLLTGALVNLFTP